MPITNVGNGMENLKETWDNLKIIPFNQRTCNNCTEVKYSKICNECMNACLNRFPIGTFNAMTTPAQYSGSKWKNEKTD